MTQLLIYDNEIIVDKRNIDIVKFIEDNDKYIRSKYLEIIESISNSNILKSKFFYNHQYINNFFYSFEKNPYKFEFLLLLKIIAINEILKGYSRYKFVNKIKDKKLKGSLDIILKKNNKVGKLYFINKLYWFFKSLTFTLIKISLFNKKTINKKNLIFTYSNYRKNNIIPSHWKSLVNLEKNYLDNIQFISIPTDIKFLKKYSSNQDIENFISNKIFVKSFISYLFFFLKNFFFSPKISNIDIDNAFLNILSYDLSKDFCGFNLLSNIIYINFFNYLVADLPKNTSIFYIFENFSWQKIINHTCLALNFKKCYAFQHSSVRFWDTRYFCSFSKNYPSKYLICNKSYYQYLNNNFNLNLHKVENLRLVNKSSLAINKNCNKIIIYLDYILEHNRNLLKFIEKSNFLLKNFEFIIKSNHLNDYLKYHNIGFKFTIFDESTESMNEFSNFIVVGASGVVEDLILLNITPLVYVPSDNINLSPLKNINDDIFFNDINKLLLLISRNKKIILNSNFYLGKDLKLWKYQFNE